jgi:EAL domain-containing protein (putative c-di-GMP-specific phosphodiesterase class I)
LLLGNNELVLRALRDLKKMGIEISMDDFGTGYSSLGYLRQFPFDKIKVDRSFVSSLAASTESVAIVRAIVGLATGLGMTTLAEGVETVEQLDSLVAEGCAQGQGFYFSRPVPATEIRAMLGDRRALPAPAQAAAA